VIEKQFPAIIIVAPLVMSILMNLMGILSKKGCYYLTVVTVSVSLISAIGLLQQVINSGKISYRLGGWDPPWGIEYMVDHLNAYLLVIVTAIALLAAIFSLRPIERVMPARIPQFYSLFLLLTTGLIGMTITGDAFNLYVLIEITSISCYALIAKGDDRSPLASFNYLIIGTVGACFYLLGVGYLYIMTGSLNMLDIAKILPTVYGTNAIVAAFSFFMVGIAIKMAFFPVHGWLPNAYTHSPDVVSAFMAATVTKVSAYVMIRVMFTVFDPSYSLKVFPVMDLLGWLSVGAMMYGCTLALAQREIKRLLSYIIIAEVGYIVVGISVANRLGFIGSVLHIMNDAIMMVCLFLVAGAVAFKTGAKTIDDYRGLAKRMPLSAAAFLVGTLSVVGVPPTCGFFSKWYLLLGTIEAGRYIYTAALLLSSLMSAIVGFRVLQSIYSTSSERPSLKDEAPLSMLGPIYVSVVAIMVIGFFSGDIINAVIQHTVPHGFK
jgi:multicomponent Na+:H+ antiporter subunit D